jgi:hypothetical protein
MERNMAGWFTSTHFIGDVGTMEDGGDCQPMSIIRKLGDDRLTGIFDPAVLGIQSDKNHGVRIVEHGGKRKNNNTHTIEKETFMPVSESLHDTFKRFLPLWIQGIAPHIRSGRTVCVVAHANTIRSILFAIDCEVATKETAKMIKTFSVAFGA